MCFVCTAGGPLRSMHTSCSPFQLRRLRIHTVLNVGFIGNPGKHSASCHPLPTSPLNIPSPLWLPWLQTTRPAPAASGSQPLHWLQAVAAAPAPVQPSPPAVRATAFLCWGRKTRLRRAHQGRRQKSAAGLGSALGWAARTDSTRAGAGLVRGAARAGAGERGALLVVWRAGRALLLKAWEGGVMERQEHLRGLMAGAGGPGRGRAEERLALQIPRWTMRSCCPCWLRRVCCTAADVSRCLCDGG